MPKLAGSTVSCNLGTIASGQSVTVLVSVTAPVEASGSISINSTVSCPAEDDFVHSTAGDNVSVS